MAANADDGWEEIEFALDSGATERVMGRDMLSSVEIKEGAARKRGVEYEDPGNSLRTWFRRSFRLSVKRA